MKRLRLLKEALPKAARPKFGLHLQSLPTRNDQDLPAALEAARTSRADALFVVDEVRITAHKTQVLRWAAKARLPVIAQYRELTASGALMSYGPSIPEMYRRAAYFVDKILKGAKPADLPVEQPTRFELALSSKAASALGLTIPPELLLRADEVIK